MTDAAEVRPPGAGAVTDWLTLARLPFHSVGVLPFVLGTVLAARSGAPLRADLLAAGLAVALAVMLATYLLGECFDTETDALSARMERNRFSGGSHSTAVTSGRIARRRVLHVSAAAAGAAALGGVYVVAASGHLLLLPLGLFGLAAGVCYSLPPVRLAYRGVGETLIGICYGPVPVMAAFLMQTGRLSWQAGAVSVPVGLTIFNVILINEFPDEPADRLAGKRNLVVRLGRRGAAWVYAAAGLLTAASLALLAALSAATPAAWAALGTAGAAAGLLSGAVLGGLWRSRRALEALCALTLALNLAVSTAAMFVCRV